MVSVYDCDGAPEKEGGGGGGGRVSGGLCESVWKKRERVCVYLCERVCESIERGCV